MDLRLDLQKGNHIRHWKTSQLSTGSEVVKSLISSYISVLISTDNCSPTPSSKKFTFARDRVPYGKAQVIKMPSCCAQFKQYIYNIRPAPGLDITAEERVEHEFYHEIVSSSNVKSYSHKDAPES